MTEKRKGPTLPTDLEAFLREQEWATLFLETDQLGTILLVKAPGYELRGVTGRYLVRIQQQLSTHPGSPVIRSVFTLYLTEGGGPMVLETFINVGDARQLEMFAALGHQEHLHLVFYDQDLTVIALKTIRAWGREEIPKIVRRALQELDRIPVAARDFDTAKADILAKTPLSS